MFANTNTSITLFHRAEQLISGKNAMQALAVLAKNFPGRILFSTSFGLEDQVITHIIGTQNLPIGIFTIDTGRVFNETYSVWNQTREKYNVNIDVYYPDTKSTEELVSKNGPFSFYESVEKRRECCRIRKVEPLERALKGNEIWITGIRKEQSENRQNMKNTEWDEKHRIVKFHPLFDWTFNEIKNFIAENNIPYNPLHDKGFPSIGCAPCTRAVNQGEDMRAGRWWWENNNGKKECGLHGKLKRNRFPKIVNKTDE